MEAFDFRIIARDNELFKAEIHWDDGSPEEINDRITAESAIDIINGYFTPEGYHAVIAKHNDETVFVKHRQPALFRAVVTMCSKLRTGLDDSIGNVELEVIDAYLGQGRDVSETMAICRCECIREMKKIRDDMDKVSLKLASGNSQWSRVQLGSHHSHDIVGFVNYEMRLIYEETQEDNTHLVWTYNELKFKLRLYLQENYQQRFAVVIDDPV
jgi:hypothetical protein